MTDLPTECRLGHSEVTLIKRIINDLNIIIVYFCHVNKMTSYCDAWFFLIHYCKRNFPMTRCVRLLAGRSVGLLVGLSFRISLKSGNFLFHALIGGLVYARLRLQLHFFFQVYIAERLFSSSLGKHWIR